MKKTLFCLTLCFAVIFTLVSCSNIQPGFKDGDLSYEGIGTDASTRPAPEYFNTPKDSEEYGKYIENSFINTSENPISTFSADVDTASYTYFRKLVNNNYSLAQIISSEGKNIHAEEMVNYFDYSYPQPEDGKIFGTSVQIADCPWNSEAALMVLGLQSTNTTEISQNNLVFLIDVSGSMGSNDKLPLIKKAFTHLIERIGGDDIISIVTYSGEEKIVLNGCSGDNTEQIMNAINSLKASGATNGQAGIQMAYQIAKANFIEGGNNRIIMASDGDLNVGISSADGLLSFVEEMREDNVYMSVLGFGTGNYKSASMSAIAQSGNGVYYYIDDESEAEKVFGSDLFSTLYTVATDVKLQLSFNPDSVSAYRLVGYESRLLSQEDFEDDTKDAADVGTGHSFTVCYELILTENAKTSPEWVSLSVRYKKSGESSSSLDEYKFGSENFTESPNPDFLFISCVIRTSMLIRSSRYAENISLQEIYNQLLELDLSADSYKNEFKNLIGSLINR